AAPVDLGDARPDALGRGERVLELGPTVCAVAIEGGDEQGVLAAELVVEAAPADPHRGRQVLHRGGLEPLAPEDVDGAAQHVVAVELPWSSGHASQGSAF